MLIFGDDPKDREVVLGLAKAAGLRGVPPARSPTRWPPRRSLRADRHQPQLQGRRRRDSDYGGLKGYGPAQSRSTTLHVPEPDRRRRLAS